MRFTVTILGSNSATPAHGRHPTSQFLQLGDHYFLIDCGEGTQIRLNDFKLKWGKLSHIFISHLHGDHYFGLIGLLTTFHLNQRNKPLHIHSYPELKPIIDLQLATAGTVLNYPLHFHEIEKGSSGTLFEDSVIRVRNFPLDHRIPCSGFVFTEKGVYKKLLPEMIEKHKIPYDLIPEIRNGGDFKTSEGEIVPNSLLTEQPGPPRSYAYCTDTRALESTAGHVEGVDLLYHESTFDAASADRAQITFHSTTTEAAKIAKKARVGELLIGHFSSKYRNLLPLLKEARKLFPKTELALEGKSFELKKKPASSLHSPQSSDVNG